MGLDEEWSEDDSDDEEFFDPDEPLDLIPCPKCGAEIYEDAQQCPTCGEYVIDGRAPPWKGKPAWYIALAVLGVIAILVTVSGVLAWR